MKAKGMLKLKTMMDILGCMGQSSEEAVTNREINKQLKKAGKVFQIFLNLILTIFILRKS